jgi:type IV secretion system protein VirB6
MLYEAIRRLQSMGTVGAVATAAAMTPAQVFSRIADLMLRPLVEMLEQVIQGTALAVQVLAVGYFAIYVIFLILEVGSFQIDAFAFVRKVAVGGFFLCCALGHAWLNAWMIGFLVYGLPAWVTGSVSRGIPGAGDVGLDSNGFGHILSDTLLMGVDLWKSLGWTDWGAALLTVVLMIVAIGSIGHSWWMWFKARLWIVVLIAIWPIAAMAAIAPWSRQFATRWLDTMWGFCALMLVATLFVVVLLGAEGLVVKEFIAAKTNAVDKVMLIISAVCVFVAFFFMSADIPRVAASIGGGVIMHGAGAAVSFGLMAGWTTARLENYRRRASAAANGQPAPANP